MRGCTPRTSRGRSAHLALPLCLTAMACVTGLLPPARELARAASSPSPARRRGPADARHHGQASSGIGSPPRRACDPACPVWGTEGPPVVSAAVVWR
jgi:hypothetical protein